MSVKIILKKIILIFSILFFLGTSLIGCDKVRQLFIERFDKLKEEQLSSESSKDIILNETAESNASSQIDKDSPPGETVNSTSAVSSEPAPDSEATAETSKREDINEILDLELQRKYFTLGVESFEEKNYVIAEFYLNKIKYSYNILADHVLYYLAKSQLVQEKYELTEENYLKLKINYPESIFAEKANLEYADLFFIRQDYLTSEINYENFIKNFPQSELLPYSLYQLAVCMEKNSKFISAFENYKRIWLEYPENEFASNAYSSIERLAGDKIIDTFIPTNDNLYSRGEKFYNLYRYESAIAEFTKILDSDSTSNLPAELHAKTLFKTGMCYLNLRDYSKSRDFLLSCYGKFPLSSYADDSLYFLGRAETSLGREDSAIDYYDKVVKNFPASNYSDDALYRTGRIYFLRDEIDKAKAYYQQIINQYPDGDKAQDAYWEVGWIEYRIGDYSAAKNTFSDMVSRFKGSQISTAAHFWKAKSYKKLGETQEAVNIYKEIIAGKSYSYYTFASIKELEEMQVSPDFTSVNREAMPYNPEISEVLPEVYKDIENNYTDSGSGNEDLKFSHIDKVKELLLLEFYLSADREIEAASKEFEEDNMGILQISTLYLWAKDYVNSQKIIAKYYSKLNSGLNSPYRDYFYYLLYPYGYKEYVDRYSSEFDIDPLFVLAVIREESRFNPEAGSYAGALGLMQIIPGTGKSIANDLEIKNYTNDILYDPETSIKMGTYYLKRQMDNFSQ
ncbi:MAG: tetratricopeptide repeat protein, partial [Actinobacteria bacterium]|nr:tetratricopeptide repeat protein [Actinomycetota bacterium]